MTGSRLKQGPLTLYAQVAGILRDRIHSGIWRHGDFIPTLEELTAEFDVARVTTRQAIQILSEEGLLSSHRGKRTQVIWQRAADTDTPVFSMTAYQDSTPGLYHVDIIDYETFAELPPGAGGNFGAAAVAEGPFVRIRKRDSYRETAYTVSETYVREALFRRFPPGGETRIKLVRLAIEAANDPALRGYEEVRVGLATEAEALQLNCTVASPVARVSRKLVSGDGKILLYGRYTYPERDFALQREITELL